MLSHAGVGNIFTNTREHKLTARIVEISTPASSDVNHMNLTVWHVIPILEVFWLLLNNTEAWGTIFCSTLLQL